MDGFAFKTADAKQLAQICRRLIRYIEEFPSVFTKDCAEQLEKKLAFALEKGCVMCNSANGADILSSLQVLAFEAALGSSLSNDIGSRQEHLRLLAQRATLHKTSPITSSTTSWL